MTTPRKRTDREGPLHRAILAYLRTVLPDALIHHSPNEINQHSTRTMRQIMRNRTMGTVTGFPDLIIETAQGTLYLEIKAPGGRVSKDQRAVLDALTRLGARCAVVRSVEDTRAALAAWGIKTKEVR